MSIFTIIKTSKSAKKMSEYLFRKNILYRYLLPINVPLRNAWYAITLVEVHFIRMCLNEVHSILVSTLTNFIIIIAHI